MNSKEQEFAEVISIKPATDFQRETEKRPPTARRPERSTDDFAPPGPKSAARSGAHPNNFQRATERPADRAGERSADRRTPSPQLRTTPPPARKRESPIDVEAKPVDVYTQPIAPAANAA